MSVAKELRKLMGEPLDGIKVQINEEDVTDVTAEIMGPEQTPFEGGVFKVKLMLPSDYPNAPPKCACSTINRYSTGETTPTARRMSLRGLWAGFFLTRIFHPNISKTGEICVNTLKKDWQSNLGVGHVLQVVRCLMINPFPESALNDEAGKLFMEAYDEYCKKACMYTEVHARPSSNKADASGEGEPTDGEEAAKRQKPVDNKAADKRRMEKKKSLKRL